MIVLADIFRRFLEFQWMFCFLITYSYGLLFRTFFHVQEVSRGL